MLELFYIVILLKMNKRNIESTVKAFYMEIKNAPTLVYIVI